jgi:hypothetical protein
MSKFLRKYKQWILVVGGCLLMVAWLFPQALQQLNGAGGFSSTVARYEGGKLTGADFHEAQQELRALTEITPLLPMALGLSNGRSLNNNAAEHWLLLTREAEKGGWIGGPSDGKALLEEMAPAMQQRLQMSGQQGVDLQAVRTQLEQARLRSMAGHTEKWADTVLARAAGIMRMVSASRSLGISFSEKESALFAWELYDAAVTDLVLVPASSVSSEVTPPDDARIAAHFEKYKSVRPGTGDMGIGYLRQAAVKVEWLSIARQAVIDAMPADPVEVNKFWRQNKARFGENYTDVKAAVESELKRQQGEKLLEKARDAVARQVLKSSSGVESEGKYKKLPADWATKMPSLESLAEAARAALDLPGSAGMVIANPTDHRFRTMGELTELPGIGSAGGRVGDAQFVQFSQAATEVRELGKQSLPGTQVGVLYGPISDAMGSNDYYFRVLEARPESAPDSLTEVLDKVKADIADMDGFEILKKQADAYKERLAAKGIGDVLTIPGVRSALDAVVRREYTTGSDPNQPLSLREVDTKSVRDAVMSLVENWDPKADVAAKPASERVVAVAEPASKSLVLGLVKARRPLTTEKLAASENEVFGYARQRILGGSRGIDPFTFEAVSARMKYVPVRAKTEESESKPAGSTPASEPAKASN